MSFGGGREQYILEYIVKVTNQGGAGGLTQLNTGMKQLDTTTKQVSVSQQQLVTAQNKVQQAGLGMSKALKGMTFGFIGIGTAGAEAVGMLSMWQSTQEGVQQAQDDVNQALKEGGKGSKDYKDAVQELTKAQRWQRMTTRNLMLSMFDLVPFIVLSVNGMLKAKRASQELRTAQAELKVVQDALSKSNSTLAITNEAANASQLSLVKGSKGVAAANLSTNGSLITMIPNLTKQRAAMAASTGIMAKFRGGLASIAAGIGSVLNPKLLLIIATIGSVIVAIEAWKNNWGGFGDAINKAGVAIGNMHPWLKMLMEDLAKVGLTVDALIHGNFEDIKSIWEGAPKEGPIATMTKAEEKAAEEYGKLVEDVQSHALELMSTIAQADHKERGGILKAMGFKGNAKKELQDVFDGIDEVQDSFKGLGDTLQVMSQIDILGDNWGLKIDKKKLKKGLFTLEDRINEAAKDTFKKGSTGRTILKGLADALHKDAKSKNPENAQAVADYLIQHPEVIKLAKESGAPQEVVDALTVKYKEALKKQQAELKAEQAKIIAGANNMKDTPRSEIGSDIDKGMNSKGLNVGQGPNDGGMFSDLLEQLKGLPKSIEGIVKGTDWVGMGATVRTALLGIFNINNAQNLGQFLRNNVLNPVIGALQGVFGKWIADLQADPVKAIMGTANMIGAPIAAFVAGLFGFQDEAAMDKAMKGGMEMFSAKVIHAVDNFINNTPWLWDLLHGDIIGALIEISTGAAATASKNIQQSSIPISNPDMSKVVDPSITGVINKAWQRALFWLQQNQWLTELFSGNPIPMFIEFMKHNTQKNQTANVVSGIPLPTAKDNGMDKFWTNNIQPQLNVMTGWGPKLTSWWNGLDWISQLGAKIWAGLQSASDGLKEFITGIVQTVHAEPTGNTTTDTTTNGNTVNTKITVTADTKTAQSALGSVQISLSGIASTSQAMDSVVSKSLNSMTQTAQVDAGMVKDTFASSFGEVESLMDTMAHDWSTVMNSFINNAKSAANGVNSALAKIKNIDRTITFHVQTVGSAPSGSGFKLHAVAKGFHGVVDSPTLFLAGEAGKERVDVSPHGVGTNASAIASLTKSKSNTPVVINNTFKLDGTGIINNKKLNQQVKFTIGENRDKFG